MKKGTLDSVLFSSVELEVPQTVSNILLWLRSDYGLYQDSAKTTAAAADSDPVGAAADKSGNGNDVLQITTSKKPILKLNQVNGHATIQGDNSDDYLGTDKASFSGQVQPYTLFLVCHRPDTQDNYLSFGSVGSGMFIDRQGGNLRVYAGEYSDASVFYNDSYHIFSFLFNGSASICRRDGAETTNLNFGTNPLSDLILFADSLGGHAGNIDLLELILYAGDKSSSFSLIETYLSTRYNISIS